MIYSFRNMKLIPSQPTIYHYHLFHKKNTWGFPYTNDERASKPLSSSYMHKREHGQQKLKYSGFINKVMSRIFTAHLFGQIF